MSALTAAAVRRPVLTGAVTAAVLLLGLLALVRLPVQLLPDVSTGVVTVRTGVPGADAEVVRTRVSDPLTAAVRQVGGVTGVTATSSTGASALVVQLGDDVDPDQAAAAITQAVGRVQQQLPDGAAAPVVTAVDPEADPVLVLALTGADATVLTTAATDQVLPAVQGVDGVGQVTVAGEQQHQVTVTLRPERLAAHGLGVAEVVAVLGDQVGGRPGGTLAADDLDAPVTVAGAATAAQVGATVVGGTSARPVHLADVAVVAEDDAPVTEVALVQGVPAVTLSVSARSGGSQTAVADSVAATARAVAAGLPAGVALDVVADNTGFTRAALRATAEDLLLAVLLAALAVLLFVQSLRLTVVVATAIPTSLLATAFVMWTLGFALDVISLLAAVLLVGILVDDAVVVLEGIVRQARRGLPARDAAVAGRREVGAAAVALTLTDVVVFAPLTFATGTTRAVAVEFAVTVVVATLVSLAVSFTLTPVLAAGVLGRTATARRRRGPLGAVARAVQSLGRHLARWCDTGLDAWGAGYARLLTLVLRRRAVAHLAALACLGGTVGLVLGGALGLEQVPEGDPAQVVATVVLPPGTGTDAAAQALAGYTTAVLHDVPDATTVTAATGTALRATGGVQATVTVGLTARDARDEDLGDIRAGLVAAGRTVPGATVTTRVPNPFVSARDSGVPVQLHGDDPETLAAAAHDVAAALATVPEVREVTDPTLARGPAYTVTLRGTAADLGVDAAGLAQVLAVALGGSEVAVAEGADGTDLPLVVQVGAGAATTPAELEALPVTSVAARGSTAAGAGASARRAVRLAEVAEVARATAATPVTSVDGVPQITVGASPATGTTSDVATAAVKAAVRDLTLPDGVTWNVGGQDTSRGRAWAPLLLALGLSPVLIYLLLAALYESVVLPLAVLLTVPLATAGGLGALAATGTALDLFGLLGLLMLVGLVSKNAILLVDRTEQLRRGGLDRTTALVAAGRTRLRPILMTSLTVVAAMAPVALSQAPGAEYRTPMALVLIGGMTLSTLLTLVVCPALYVDLDRLRRAAVPTTETTTPDPAGPDPAGPGPGGAE